MPQSPTKQKSFCHLRPSRLPWWSPRTMARCLRSTAGSDLKSPTTAKCMPIAQMVTARRCPNLSCPLCTSGRIAVGRVAYIALLTSRPRFTVYDRTPFPSRALGEAPRDASQPGDAAIDSASIACLSACHRALPVYDSVLRAGLPFILPN